MRSLMHDPSSENMQSACAIVFQLKNRSKYIDEVEMNINLGAGI